jgi:hypothetical protein
MPSRRSGNDLVLFSSQDPKALVNWLVESFGLQTILKSLSEQMPGGIVAPQRASKKAGKKGGKRGRPKGSKNGSKKGAKKASKRSTKAQGNEKGNG